MTKRQNGDRWGVMAINTLTGEQRPVDNPYWPSNVHSWERSAREEAQERSKTAQEFNHNETFEACYVGNVKTGQLTPGFY